MRRFWLATAAATGGLGAAMALSLPLPGFGSPLWHYNAAFAAVLLGAAMAWGRLQRRRVATLSMAFTGAVAATSGFGMLYTKQFAHKEWLTWWHSVTSVAFALAFLVHWLHNNARLADLTRRLFAPPAPGILAAGAWTGVVAFGVWTGMADVRVRFTSENYLNVSSWTIVAGVAFAYGLWLAYRVPSLRARLAETPHRRRARGLVDSGLFLANWGSLLTGFALLYFADPLRGGTFKYVSKWWHTATSVLLLALVALHVGFNARLVARHAARLDEDLGRV